MKAPVPENAKDAVALGRIIGEVIATPLAIAMYSVEFVLSRWRQNTFQHKLVSDWEHAWTYEQCQKIMAAWVTYRIER